MKKRWQKLSQRDRTKVLIITAFVMIGLYGTVFYSASYGKLGEAEAMLSRRQNRIETRTQVNEVNISTSPKKLEKEIEDIELVLKKLQKEVILLNEGFVDLNDSGERQRLLLEISELARECGVMVQKTVENGTDKIMKRPLLIIAMQGKYNEILRFVDGLKGLSNHVAVMHITLKTGNTKQKTASKGKKQTPARLIQTSITLVI